MKKLNLVLTAVLVVAMSYMAADVLWLIFKPKAAEPAILIAEKTRQAELTLPAHIFGSKKAAPVQTPLKTVKQSKLNLTLTGVLFKRKNPLVIIAPSGKSSLAKAYKVGDKVKTGVLVHEIGANFVLLKRSGKLEKLMFKKAGGTSDITSMSGKKNQSKLSTVQKSKVNDYRLEIVNNPKKLLSLVNVMPFFENGKMSGIKVRPSKDKATFNALGFKSGDVITKINHINIDNFNKFAKIRQMIYASANFDLSVKRNKKIIYLSIQL